MKEQSRGGSQIFFIGRTVLLTKDALHRRGKTLVGPPIIMETDRKLTGITKNEKERSTSSFSIRFGSSYVR